MPCSGIGKPRVGCSRASPRATPRAWSCSNPAESAHRSGGQSLRGRGRQLGRRERSHQRRPRQESIATAPSSRKWYELFGSEEYIYWAYKYAHDALEANAPGSSAGQAVLQRILGHREGRQDPDDVRLAEGRKGIQVDGVGFQSHENMSWPCVERAAERVRQVRGGWLQDQDQRARRHRLRRLRTGSFVASPEVPYTAELEAAQAERFAALVRRCTARTRTRISSVTFWGVSDDHTWLD